MADVSDSAINEGKIQQPILNQLQPDHYARSAYLDVRSDKTETNWLLLDYQSDRSDTLTVTQTGTGGLTELREVLDDSKASFAYVRISVHAADVKSVLRVYSIEVAAREKGDLDEDPIVIKLRKVNSSSATS
ncbi:hypothetical protein ONZ45_g14248 [Pleurotus djamor]|nr:hypothetical protein ONZ45_g14248 [Pleurotus djamor]